jgi:transposase
MAKTASAEKVVREIRRPTRRRFSAEEKIPIVLEGLRGEESIAALCRRDGLAPNLYKSSSCRASSSATRPSASRRAPRTRGMACATSGRSPASRRRSPKACTEPRDRLYYCPVTKLHFSRRLAARMWEACAPERPERTESCRVRELPSRVSFSPS